MIIHQGSIKLQIFLAYIVIGGLPFYYFLREWIEISSSFYAGLLSLLFLVSLNQILRSKINPKSLEKKFFILEIMIALDILFIFLYLGHIERSLALLVVTLYISKGLFALKTKHGFKTASNIITCSAFIAAIGIIFGLFELMFGSSYFFIQKMGFDYPYSDGLKETILVNGFFASPNSSAYAIGAGLAFLKFQNIFQDKLKGMLYIFFIIALISTKTKFVFLIAATYLGFILCQKMSIKLLMLYLLLLGMSYLFLSHIMIALSGAYDYPSLHFREKLFSIGSIDFILGNYGMFKLYSLEAISSNLFLPGGLLSFVNTYEGRPHFMLGGLMISGGIMTAVLVYSYIYFLLKDSWNEVLIGIKDHQLYLTIMFCFIVETFNWNFTNNFYFWAIIMGLGSINKYKNI
tara:strand:- start:2636 stop:3847 length:1212 start_codon:yes stop_codon:yes gene_type:complete